MPENDTQMYQSLVRTIRKSIPAKLRKKRKICYIKMTRTVPRNVLNNHKMKKRY